MDKQETLRCDTLSQCYEALGEVLRTIDIDKELREILIEPMRRDGKVVGYETIIRWIDKHSAHYVR